MDLKTIGERIKELRLKNSMSQEAFAEKIGLDRSYICRIESGQKNLTLETLIKICEGLNVSLKELFDFESVDKVLADNDIR
ncbi:MAG: helix-turn-helix domain-containing protein [Acholeplasmatales bacterium]|nr:helix-turn-helix domain-containing protein [Acholeplasmatales bacterium]